MTAVRTQKRANSQEFRKTFSATITGYGLTHRSIERRGRSLFARAADASCLYRDGSRCLAFCDEGYDVVEGFLGLVGVGRDAVFGGHAVVDPV